MVPRNILASEFPQRRVEVTDIDDVTGGVIDFDAIADAKRLADENVYPGDETFHRCLHGQAQDDRSHAECGERRIPVYKNHRHGNYRNQQPGD